MGRLKRLVLTLISASLLLSLLLVATAYAAPSANHSEYSSFTVIELFELEDAGEITTEDLIAELKLRKANRVGATSEESLGRHLVDSDGNTLYLFTRDERNVSNCSGGCAAAWPPKLVHGDPISFGGINAGRLSTIERDDGGTQATYNGKPLYYYASDENPGDTLGQDRGDVWFLVSSDGGPIRTAAKVIGTDAGDMGTILTDPSGNSLYLFTRDERNVSNCSGGCALAWPPLLTVDDPVAGEGLDEGRIGTIDRSDGSKQVTYNGWPLYYYATDAKPGDTMGQDRGGVWFVVNTDGGPVYINAPVTASENGELGTILMDASGRSLYLFTNDERNVSNCSGGCALAWPPLITVEDPAPGDRVSAARVGTITREDGSKQVTFDGNPLYYYATDEKPGDALGQNRGGVWYVISNTQQLMIALGEQNDSGQSGTAVLSGRGSFTNVSLDLSAGTLETELVHIHAGQCAPGDLGGVVHALTSFEGGSGASVTNVPVSMDDLIFDTGGFAVNTHKAEEASVYTSCGNIPSTSGLSNTIAFQDFGWDPNHKGATGSVTYNPLASSFVAAVSVADLMPDHNYNLYVMENDLTGATNLDATTYPFTTDDGGAATINVIKTYQAAEGAPLPAFQVHFLVVDQEVDLTGTLPNPLGVAHPITLACSFPLGFLQLNVPEAPSVSLNGDSVPLYNYGWAPGFSGGSGNVSYTGQSTPFEATVTVGDLKPDHEYVLFMMSSALNGEKTFTEMPFTTDDSGGGAVDVSHTFDVPDGVPLPALQVHFLVIDRSEVLTDPPNPFGIENPIVLACLFPLGFIQF